jgi:hypothetical protein
MSTDAAYDRRPGSIAGSAISQSAQGLESAVQPSLVV